MKQRGAYMKKILLGIVAVLAFMVPAVGSKASAQVVVRVGPRYHHPYYHHRYYHRGYHHRGYYR
jgi:hypothetical protein